MKVLYAILLLATAVSAYKNVTVKNLRLFDGNTEFFIKSICYSPAPAGYAFGNPTQGSGVCSLRQQYAISADQHDIVSYSACYYEDFFDGSVDIDGKGNQQGWFKDIWTRDLPVMAAAGTNTVRFYHTNPITKDLVYADAGYKYKGYGSDYRPFMDACSANGLKVVFPLFAELTQLLNFPQAKMEEYVRSLVDNVGGHDALLMWQFGNELPLSVQDNNLGPTIIAKLNHFFDYARAYTFRRWQRHVPISIALVDLPSWYNTLSRELKVDVITTNAGYRGPTYSDLWYGNSGQNFDGLHSLSCETGKPVFIGEIGQHSTDGYVNYNTWFQENWAALLDNYKNGAIGGALFEYSDEAWKAENQRHMGIVMLDSDTHVTLKTSGGAYDYTAVKAAFAKDPFGGRTPFTLDNVDNSACSMYSFQPRTGPIYPLVDIGTPNTNPPASQPNSPAPTDGSANNGNTDNSGNSGNSGNNGGATPACGAGLSQCGKACYKPKEYCCVNDALYPIGASQCTAVPNPSGNGGAATSNNGGAATTVNNGGAATSNNGNNGGAVTSNNGNNGGAATSNNGNNGGAVTSNNGNNGGAATSNNGNANPGTTQNGNNGNSGNNNGNNDNNGNGNTVGRDQGSAAQLFAAAVTVLALLAIV